MLFGQNSWLNQDVLHIPQGTFFSLRSANDQLSFWTLAAWCCGKPYYSGAEPSVRLSFGTRNEFPVEQLQKVCIDMHPSVGAADTLHKDTLHKPLGFSGSFTKFHLQTKIHQLATERSLLCARQAKTTSHMLSQNMWTYVENIFKSLVLRLVTGKIGRSMCSFAWQGFAKYKLFRCCQFRARRFEGPSCLQELAEPCWTCNVRWDSYRPRKLNKISKIIHIYTYWWNSSAQLHSVHISKWKFVQVCVEQLKKYLYI